MPIQNNIELPRDQYRHPEAPNEWWWHIGSLKSGDRLFGFEINATGGVDPSNKDNLLGFSQIMVSDVNSGRHYQLSTVFSNLDKNWAQTDPALPWHVSLGSEPASSGSIRMSNPAEDWWTMTVTARATDDKTQIGLDLTMTQNGPPLLAWGTGVTRGVNPSGKNPFERDNFYYSLTNLSTHGQLTIGSEIFAVAGLTWMDHEYGAFSNKFRWVLQNAQLDNGVHLENFTTDIDYIPKLNVTAPSKVTILWPNGECVMVDSKTTPLAPVWCNSEGGVFFLRFRVQIPSLNADLTFTATIADQEFRSLPIPGSNPVYEGNAFVDGAFDGAVATGLGWIEESIGVESAG